jgi:hypothetical protein
MDINIAMALSIAGTAAFCLGVAMMVSELSKKGLTKRSLIAYLLFLASMILLSDSLVCALLSSLGLSLIFIVLYLLYLRDRKSSGPPPGNGDE